MRSPRPWVAGAVVVVVEDVVVVEELVVVEPI